MWRVWVIGLVTLVAAGCGDAARPGRLEVRKALPDGPVFTEGSLTDLRIVSPSGDVIVDGPRPLGPTHAPLFVADLPAGRYTLASVERPCEGACPALDPPAARTRCSLNVDLHAGHTTRVTITLARNADGLGFVNCLAEGEG